MFRLLLVVLLGASSSFAVAQRPDDCNSSAERDTVGAAKFLSRLQQAVASDDRTTVISMIQFPVQSGAAGDMLSEAQFVAAYGDLLNDRAIKILALQKSDSLFGDERGMAVGNGEIWFSKLSGVSEFRVTMFRVSKYAGVGITSMEETEQIDRLFLQFQRALKKGDRQSVSSILSYPIRVNLDHGSLELANAADLLRNYDQAFTTKVRQAVLSQRISNLFVNSDGIMVGTGQVWFSPKRDGQNIRLHITTINT